jgi:hypothetical protein
MHFPVSGSGAETAFFQSGPCRLVPDLGTALRALLALHRPKAADGSELDYEIKHGASG